MNHKLHSEVEIKNASINSKVTIKELTVKTSKPESKVSKGVSGVFSLVSEYNRISGSMPQLPQNVIKVTAPQKEFEFGMQHEKPRFAQRNVSLLKKFSKQSKKNSISMMQSLDSALKN